MVPLLKFSAETIPSHARGKWESEIGHMEARISAEEENFLQHHEHGQRIRNLFCTSLKTCRVSKSKNEQCIKLKPTMPLLN
jgi:hypothetical protein